MADRLPLRIVYVNGVPTIGEFQRGDTVGVNSGGTGVSSLNELADLLDAIPGGALSSLTDDVGIGFPFSDPAYGDVLTWTGSRWEAEHVPHMAFADYSGAPFDISSVSFLTNLGSVSLQEGQIAWDGDASTIQVQTDASTTQLAVLQVSSASNDGDILLWDGTNGYYYPTSAFVDVSSQVDLNTSTLENTLDASDLSVELSAISTELSAVAVDISAVGIEVSSVSVQLSSLVSSIHLSGLGDTTFTDLSTHQHIVYDGSSWVNAYNDTTEMRVRNGTASAMSKGDVIAIENAHNQNLVNVILADASQTSAMPALGILEQDLSAGAEGIAITFGKAQGLNTSGLTEGATAYVSPTTPGTITETKPTDTSHLIQNIGIIMRAHASNGAIKVTGIGRANDIDNQTRDTIQYVNGPTFMPQINSGYSSLTEWTEGSGAMTDWDLQSDMEASSNVREFAPDPFNGSSIVWKAYDDGPSDGSVWEGGFYAESGFQTTVDASKPHRCSIFVKQHDNTVGSLYFGPANNHASQNFALVRRDNGLQELNPYFTFNQDNPTTDEWYLYVGYINPSGLAAGSNNYDDLAGIYDMGGNKLEGNFGEYDFSSTTIYTSLRAFYYNDTANDAAIGASFWHPRIDALDGNEPSIKDLLKLFTTQHGQLDGLDQNDHPQYVLSSTNSTLSSTVDSKVNKELVGHYIAPWEEGSHHQSAPTDWTSNGTSSLREFDTDPFGNQSIIWKAIDDDVASDGEGGFNSGKVPADSSSTYRFSCFIKQENTASGGAYLGCYAYSSLEGATSDHRVDIRGAGAPSGTGSPNTYFISNQKMPSTDWYLAVAYLHPYQTETGPSTRQESGIYKISTGEKVPFSIIDKAFDDPTAIGLNIRAYHYNNPAGTGDAIQFFQPRIDIVDGNEPSIADLLGIVPRSDYVLSSTNSALSAQVDTNTSAIDNALDLSDIVTYIEHGDLNGLGDNDHPQYVLSATNSGLSSVVDALGAFSYMQMTSDGTAGTTELNIGRGATQTVVEDGSTNIVWDSANNEFDVSATGTYHVLANLVLDVAATATIDLKIKKNTTAMNTFAAHGVHSAEDPEEVTMQCVFTASAGDTISVTFDELGSNNVTPKSGTNIMVRRLA